MTSFYIILGVALWVALAFWPAVRAKRKGYSFVLFLIIALFISWLLALLITVFLKDKNATAEDIADDKAAEEILDNEPVKK